MDFLILTLAVWRITNLFVNEDGPGEMFAWFRHLVGINYDESGIAYADNAIGGAFSCLWCLSVWVGLIAMILYVAYPQQVMIASLPFALSAGAIMVDKWQQ